MNRSPALCRRLCSSMKREAIDLGRASLIVGLAALGIPSGAQSTGTTETFVLAGGCFWGVEYVFEHVQGVRSVTSGYARDAGSTIKVPVEAVRIVFDPGRVSRRQLLDVFFAIAHDPTSRDRQGPDAGPEYRAVVFGSNPAEDSAATAFIATLERAHRFKGPIVTEVRRLGDFRIAEPFHQDYATRHPRDPYILYNDAPKLGRLQRTFPALFREERAP